MNELAGPATVIIFTRFCKSSIFNMQDVNIEINVFMLLVIWLYQGEGHNRAFCHTSLHETNSLSLS